MELGIKGRIEFIVTEKITAVGVGSGGLYVLASPYMINKMEETAWSSVEPYMNPGEGTVGILVNVTHDKATPIGMKVVCESELIKIEGRKLTFKVEAYDEVGKIGGGIHERFIINNEKFQAKCDAQIGTK